METAEIWPLSDGLRLLETTAFSDSGDWSQTQQYCFDTTGNGVAAMTSRAETPENDAGFLVRRRVGAKFADAQSACFALEPGKEDHCADLERELRLRMVVYPTTRALPFARLLAGIR